MAFVQNFSTSQQVGLPSNIIVSDTSTGSDVLILSRRVYIQGYDGSYIVPEGVNTNYVPWLLADTSISIDCLTQDTAANITVQWLGAADAILYTKTILTLFTLYNKTFYYSLTQYQSSTPSIVQDVNYYDNKGKLWTAIVSAENAVSVGADIGSAQLSLDYATYLTSNQNLFF